MLSNRFAYLDLIGFGDDVKHPEHVEYTPLYTRIRDCLDARVKEKGKEYLPDPSEGTHDQELKDLRYKSYHQRASFVPVTRRTRDGLVAQVLMRRPKIVAPKDNKNILSRISSKGTSLISLANVALGENVSFGRGAFVVSYAQTAGRPFIDFIPTEDIITWVDMPYGNTDDIGRNLGSATIRTYYDMLAADGISVVKVAQLTQYTISRDGVVWVRKKQSGTATGQPSTTTKWTDYQMLRVNGNPVRHIPVSFKALRRTITRFKRRRLASLLT